MQPHDEFERDFRKGLDELAPVLPNLYADIAKVPPGVVKAWMERLFLPENRHLLGRFQEVQRVIAEVTEALGPLPTGELAEPATPSGEAATPLPGISGSVTYHTPIAVPCAVCGKLLEVTVSIASGASAPATPERKLLGYVSVDSGVLAIVDPGYIACTTGNSYSEILPRPDDEDWPGVYYDIGRDGKQFGTGSWGSAVAFGTGGDGIFPVYREGEHIIIALDEMMWDPEDGTGLQPAGEILPPRG